MKAKKLWSSILQEATQGKLVPQLSEEPTIEQIGTAPENNPFSIPDKWKWVHLGDVLTKLTDGEHKTPSYQTSGVPFISVKNISSGVIDFSKTKFVSEADHQIFKKRCNPEIGDILLSKVGTTGVPAIVNDNRAFSLFVSVALLKVGKRINSEFLWHWIQSPIVQDQAKANTRGVANKNWVLKAIGTTLIPLPPLAEQKRIVARLNKLKPLVDSYGQEQEQLEKLESDFPEQLRKSILQEAIQGKLVPQQDDEPEVEQIGEAPEDVPFAIPEKWKWVKIKYICKYIQRGKSPKYSEIKKIPVISQKCNQWDGFHIERSKFIEPHSLKYYKNERLLQDGDLLWNSTGLGTLGRAAIYENKLNPYGIAVVDSHVTVLRVIEDLATSYYLYAFIRSHYVQSEIEALADGSTKQKELSPQTIKEYLIPLPPLEEQIRIVTRLKELKPLIDYYGQE